MLKDLVWNARSFRRFDASNPIPESFLTELVDLARVCPSAANRQPLRYKILSAKTDCEKIFPFLAWAGALKDWDGPDSHERPTGYILILSTSKAGCETDVGIVAQTMYLAAAEKGYGACMLGAIKRDEIKKAFDIPEDIALPLVVALGMPAETIVIDEIPADGQTAYYRTEDNVHHVPKHALGTVLHS